MAAPDLGQLYEYNGRWNVFPIVKITPKRVFVEVYPIGDPVAFTHTPKRRHHALDRQALERDGCAYTSRGWGRRIFHTEEGRTQAEQRIQERERRLEGVA